MVAELAVALVLLAAAGLLLRSFEKMRSDRPRLPRRSYADRSVQPAATAILHPEPDRRIQLALQTRLEQLPGADAIGVTTLLPANDQESAATFTPDGYVPPKGAGLNLAWLPQVMGNYFQAQGIPILRGRAFTPADDANAPLVVIVNRILAERYWPGQDPIGKRLHRGPAEARHAVADGGGRDRRREGACSRRARPGSALHSDESSQRLAQDPFASPSFSSAIRASIVVRGQLPPEQMADRCGRWFTRSIRSSRYPQVESMDRVVAEGQASRRFNTALISSVCRCGGHAGGAGHL